MSGGSVVAPAFASRVRRPNDLVQLLVAAATLGLIVLLTLQTPDAVATLDRTLPRVGRDPLRTLLSVGSVVASLATLAVLLTVAVDAARHRRAALVQALVSGVLGLVLGAAGERIGDAAGGVVADVLTGPRTDAALVPVVAAVAFLVGADLQRRRRWRAPSRGAVLAALACGVALGNLTLQGAVAAVLLGAVAGLAVRLASGVTPARPADDVLRAELASAGVVVDRLEVVEQHTGLARLTGFDASGPVRVTVVDPDGRGLPLVRRAARMLRFRAAVIGRPSLTQRSELEREASSAALAGAAGVPVPAIEALLAVGPAMVLVERPLAGIPLTQAGSGAEAGLAAAFAALRRLHGVGLAHGALTPDSVVMGRDGTAGFRDLRAAQPAAGELQRDLDTAALLVAGATVVGSAAAVAALRAGNPEPTPPRVTALLQPVALPAAVRRAVRGTELLAELRRALTGPDGVVAAAPRLERFSPRVLLTVAASTAAAFLLASQLSQVSILDQLRRADPLWLLAALGGSALTYAGAALALIPFVPVALSLGRTMLVQLSTAWLTLVTPPTVGHVGLNIRYLQRAGLTVGAAAASVAVSQVATVAATVLLLLVVGWASGVSTARLSLVPSGDVLLVLAVAVAVAGLLVVIAPVRRLLTRRLEPLVRQSLPQLLAAATEPRRLIMAVGGILLQNAGYVLALAASLQAFDASLALPTVLGVYLVSSAVGSVAPTPGGLGAVEAALLGGLTATGVPVAAALAAVLAFRATTFWLPAPVGWVAFVHLQRRRVI